MGIAGILRKLSDQRESYYAKYKKPPSKLIVSGDDVRLLAKEVLDMHNKHMDVCYGGRGALERMVSTGRFKPGMSYMGIELEYEDHSEKPNVWEKACKEFLKGCTCVRKNEQETCEQCLKAFCDYLRSLADKEGYTGVNLYALKH